MYTSHLTLIISSQQLIFQHMQLRHCYCVITRTFYNLPNIPHPLIFRICFHFKLGTNISHIFPKYGLMSISAFRITFNFSDLVVIHKFFMHISALQCFSYNRHLFLYIVLLRTHNNHGFVPFLQSRLFHPASLQMALSFPESSKFALQNLVKAPSFRSTDFHQFLGCWAWTSRSWPPSVSGCSLWWNSTTKWT